MQLRDLGGAAFAHVEDESGRMQMWFRADRPGDAHAMVGMLDLGDIVGITGPVTRTRRGEPSVLVDSDHAARQVAAPTAGEVPRPPGPGDALPQALPRPAQQCVAAPALRDAHAAHPRAARDARSARIPRGRDAHPAADSRRRRALCRFAPTGTRCTPTCTSASRSSCTSSACSSAATRASTRSVASFATRDCRRATTRSSRCSRRTRRTRRTTTCASSPRR